MNPTLLTASLRQRFTSPIRLLLAALMGLSSVGFAVLMRTLAPFDSLAGTLALVFSAGAIGQDLASGVLQLTFSRPQTRQSYVLSRWAAAVIGAWGALTFFVLLAATGILLRGGALSAPQVLLLVLQSGLQIAATAAVIVGLSSLARGFGDLALFAASTLALLLGAQLARARGWSQAERVIEEVQRTLQPEIRLDFLLHGDPVPWAGLAAWAAAIPLFLGLAIAVMNRREISYGDS